MLESFMGMFAKKQEAKLPTEETAWSELSFIYNTGSFEKYNPDDLMSRKGDLIYKRMMMDEQVKAVTRFKRDAITSRDYMFIMDDPEEKLSDEEKKKRIAIFEQSINIMRGSFMDSLNGIMTSMYYGFSLTEMVFAQFVFDNLTYWGIGNLKLRPFDTFKFVVDEYANIKELRQAIAGREVRLDINKFIHHINNPEYDDQYGQSELREAYRPWFGKDNAIKFYNIWLERHASGVKWVQPKDNHLTPEA